MFDELSEHLNQSWKILESWAPAYRRCEAACLDYVLTTVNSVYNDITLYDVPLFLLKYVPSGIYLYNLVRTVYTSSRKRVRAKQAEIEDIEKQEESLSARLQCADGERRARARELRRAMNRLRGVRERVRRLLARAARPHCAREPHVHQMLASLLSELGAAPLDTCSEPGRAPSDGSLHDQRAAPCRVHIKVYKRVYLKQFVKNHRQRRHNSLMKKKDDVLKVFGDWQRALALVVDRKGFGRGEPEYVTSQAARGDYSPPGPPADYPQRWVEDPYRTFDCEYEDGDASTRDFAGDCAMDMGFEPGNELERHVSQLFVLPEETPSEIAAVAEVDDP